MTKNLIGYCKELRVHSKQHNFKKVDIFQVGSFALLYLPKLISSCATMLHPSTNWILEEMQREDAFADLHSIICCVGKELEVRSTNAVFCDLPVFPLYSIPLLYFVLRDCHVTQMTTKSGITCLLVVEPYQSCILRVPKQR